MTEQEVSAFFAALGSEIATWRRRRRLTRQQLGELVDISKETVGRIERGKFLGTSRDIFRIAQALDVPYSTLVVRAEEDARLYRDDDAPRVL